jgi:hypothetical protein
MAKATSLTQTRPTSTIIYDVIDIQQIKLGVCFEVLLIINIVNCHGFYDVPRNGFKIYSLCFN